MKRKYDVVDAISRYESGRMRSEREVLRLFQYLVNTGLVWQLQGSYGRMAAALIAAGKVQAEGKGA